MSLNMNPDMFENVASVTYRQCHSLPGGPELGACKIRINQVGMVTACKTVGENKRNLMSRKRQLNEKKTKAFFEKLAQEIESSDVGMQYIPLNDTATTLTIDYLDGNTQNIDLNMLSNSVEIEIMFYELTDLEK